MRHSEERGYSGTYCIALGRSHIQFVEVAASAALGLVVPPRCSILDLLPWYPKSTVHRDL
jgi:hypothetical protein